MQLFFQFFIIKFLLYHLYKLLFIYHLYCITKKSKFLHLPFNLVFNFYPFISVPSLNLNIIAFLSFIVALSNSVPHNTLLNSVSILSCFFIVFINGLIASFLA